jgi:outer membrane lipoprotein SlyB
MPAKQSYGSNKASFNSKINYSKEVLKMRIIKIGFPLLALFSLVASGCASSMSGNVYSRDQAGKVQTVHTGEVILVREVQIEGTKSGLGGLAGGIMGFALGSTIGGGSGKGVARAAGTVAGAAAGSAIEEGATRQIGLEITVKLDNGEVVAIVQGADEKFDEGDLVHVLRRPDGTARVTQ